LRVRACVRMYVNHARADRQEGGRERGEREERGKGEEKEREEGEGRRRGEREREREKEREVHIGCADNVKTFKYFDKLRFPKEMFIKVVVLSGALM